MITAIALDDEPLALKIIANFCDKLPNIHLINTFTKPSEAIDYLKLNRVDVIFLDIQMPNISGLEFSHKVMGKSKIIFTTAFPNYALNAFDLHAVDYLLKPYSFERFAQSIQKLENFLSSEKPEKEQKERFILVKSDYQTVKVVLKEIIYIESLDDYISIHLENKKQLISRMTLKSICNQLPSIEFVRIHRSFVIPLRKVTAIRNKTVFIGDVKLAIGGSYENIFMELFKNYSPL